jgi:hypothetical protein
MGKKADKLQRVVKKLASRYGDKDADVERLQLALDILNAEKKQQLERRRFGPTETAFMTPAKQLFYASVTDAMH